MLAMAALTVFVVAMIASYSGAFAKPTLHHLDRRGRRPRNRSSTASAARMRWRSPQVGDDDAAREQVYERKADAAFVVDAGRAT